MEKVMWCWFLSSSGIISTLPSGPLYFEFLRPHLISSQHCTDIISALSVELKILNFRRVWHHMDAFFLELYISSFGEPWFHLNPFLCGLLLIFELRSSRYWYHLDAFLLGFISKFSIVLIPPRHFMQSIISSRGQF